MRVLVKFHFERKRAPKLQAKKSIYHRVIEIPWISNRPGVRAKAKFALSARTINLKHLLAQPETCLSGGKSMTLT